jgi:SNF2 family DNA or RNA helicase
LDLLGESAEHIDLLQKALDEWRLPRPFAAAEILDLSRYSERIEGFGVEKAYYCPFIARKNNGLSWVPENLAFGFFYTPAGSEEAIAIELDDKGFVELKSRVEQARRTNSETFVFPGCPKPVRTVEAEQILAALSEAKSASSNNEFKPAKDSTAKGPVERRGLVVKPNIEELDYEERRGALSIPSGLTPRLPGLLKPDFPLKPHQAEGVTWLQHLWSRSPSECRGALLADDMGLGKTLQLLTFIAAELELDHKLDPCLIVAPVSLLENWKEEIEKFFEVSAFRVLTLYGNDLSKLRLSRSEIEDELAAAGVGKLLVRNWLASARLVLTTYETLRDLEFSLSRQKWSIMICDEAQKIKNPNALVSRAAKKQNARFKIACTGTPVENTLTDLWCLFDFIQPGLLGSLNRFGQTYRRPIEAETEDEKVRIQELRELIEPQKLRRTKKEVAKDLPNKIEVPTCRTLPLSDRQRVIYSREVDRYRRQVAGSQTGSVGNHLGLIQVLRRICSDPQALYSTPGSFEPLEEAAKHSPKLSWLLTQLEEIQSKSEKVIIFCELRDLQRKLQSSIAQRFGLTPDIINGETAAAGGKSNSRQQRIKAFQSEAGFGVIILSPLAVGFGVNIQGANHVIHFTRTWNPAKEDQATDRAYRIGQTKDVYVYYPVVVAPDFITFDAKLDSLLDWKRGLSQDMLNGVGELSAAEFSDLQNVDGARALTS